jgi:hypothetical protein
MIVVAYFHYDTLRSDIDKFTEESNAKNWLYERLGFLLKEECPSTLKDLIILLINEYNVHIEMIEI